DTRHALTPDVTEDTVDAATLAALPAALRTRALRAWLRANGVPAVTSAQVAAVDALVADWHGQGPVALPAGLEAVRRSGRLHLAAPATRPPATRTGNGAQLRR